MGKLSLTFIRWGNHHCGRRVRRFLQSWLQSLQRLPLGGSLGLTWVWHSSRSCRKRTRVLVCAGGPGAAGRGCRRCFRAGPRGGSAATAGAGFHQHEAGAVLRGCAGARGQRQSITNTFQTGAVRQSFSATCSFLRAAGEARSWRTLRMMNRSLFGPAFLLPRPDSGTQEPSGGHRGPWDRQESQTMQLTKTKKGLHFSHFLQLSPQRPNWSSFGILW